MSNTAQDNTPQKPVGKVLITDDCHEVLREGLSAMGFACDYVPQISPAAAFEKIKDYEGIVINSKITVNRAFLDAAGKLRFVARLGSGMEIVDTQYARKKGVRVYNSPEGNRNAVAEQALGMLLSLLNHLCRADREVRQQIWRREVNRGKELRGKTVGIIGYGHTGSMFARKLSGFEVRVLAYDKYKSNYARDAEHVEESDLSAVQEQSDIISLHLPLTQETQYLADKAFFDRCKRGVIIINTSRGKCLKTSDLVAALENGQVGGACLDVFENEQPSTYTATEKAMYERLFSMENVILSPHIAGWTHESKYLLGKILLEKIQADIEWIHPSVPKPISC